MSHIGFELSQRDWHGAVPQPDDPGAHAFLLVATGRADASAYTGPDTPANVYA